MNPRSAEGNALLATAVALAAVVVVLAVAVEVGALFRVRARADAVADHAALAAAGAHASPGGDPIGAATRVARSMEARVVSCDCGRLPVTVEVVVDLPGLPMLARIAGPSVTATGRARLVAR